MKERKPTRSATEPIELYTTSVRLSREDRTALLTEAARRRLAGEAARIDMSGLLREILAAWREAQ